MGVTVREALKLGGLKRSTVVAGESGLDRIIKCVDALYGLAGGYPPNEPERGG